MSLKTRILFLIPSLVAHGAERQLCELARNMDPARFEIHVAVFYDPEHPEDGELWEEMASIPGIQLHSLHKRRGGAGYLRAIPRLLALVRRIRPHILHGYMDGNLPALLAGTLFRTRVVWGIRRSSADLTKLDSLSIRLMRILVRLSRFTDLAIFNSEAGMQNHSSMGMRSPRMEVVPNGFDTATFAPDPALGISQRLAWGLPDGAPLIGIVGRLNPVKDHPTFLRAAELIAQDWPEARFVCVGSGPEDYARALRELAAELGLSDRVLWPGATAGMRGVYNALSLLVLASTDEGFPNVIGEAMACGVPCITTRVGDAARLVGDTGLIVAPGDPAAIAAAVATLLLEPEAERDLRSRTCRMRICTEFSTTALAHNTEQILLSLLPGTSPTGA
jgi:glycosyltransferase involved in cell wall biosynthesis